MQVVKTPIVSPEQVENGLGAFLPGGLDVDGEAKEARVIAPVLVIFEDCPPWRFFC